MISSSVASYNHFSSFMTFFYKKEKDTKSFTSWAKYITNSKSRKRNSHTIFRSIGKF